MKKQPIMFGLAIAGAILACTKFMDQKANSNAYAESATAVSGPVGPAGNLVTINGNAVTEKDVENALSGAAKGKYYKAKAEFFDAQRAAVDAFLMDRLLAEKAKKAGISAEELKKKEIDSKVKKVSDADIKKFYDKIKAERKGMGLPELDKIKDKIKQKLEEDNKMQAEENYFASLKKEFNVIYDTTAPKLEIALGDYPARGSKDAPITIVEFSDFECPFCSRAHTTVEEVLKKNKGKVSLYFRDFPLSFHAKAKASANAARCAGEQGKFWEFHDQLFNNQKDWTQKSEEEAKKIWSDYAKKVGLNTQTFDTCVSSSAQMAKVEADQNYGESVGVTGTPAFFVNGIMLSGAVPAEEFQKVIDQEIAKSKAKKG